jgi:hypothetical protein
MAQRQRAGLITPRTQDRNLLPVPVLIEFIALYGHRRQINRHGAEEARGAHNSEDVRSKLTAGTSPYRVHRSVWTFPRQDIEYIEDDEDKLTGMAQRQRAGLITPRSQDRNLLPVSVHIEFIALYGH